MLKKIVFVILCVSLIRLPGVVKAQTSNVSRDAGGWTAVVPSADSHIIHVSSSAGNDASDGLTEGTPVKTLHQGMSLLRNGSADWLELKAGDTWDEGFGGVGDLGGRSAGEPMVITSYGAGAKPQIRPVGSGNSELFHHGSAGVFGHLYFIGLDFYDPRKDPQSPSFVKNAPDVNGLVWIGGGDDVLVENCDFRYLANGVVFQRYNSGAITNLILRRNRFLDSYSFNSGSFSEAAFLYDVDGLIVEDNVFDHNGWNDAAGAVATVFSHNIYIDECKNATVRKNLFLRAASLSVKFRSDHALASTNTLVEDNLIFESEVGLGAADGTGNVPTVASLTGFTIRNNVLLQTNRDNPTGRGLGWGMSLNDIKDSTVSGNIISDLSYSGNSFGISLGDGMETPEDHPISNVTISGNTIYRVNGAGVSIRPGASWSNVNIMGNAIQNPDQNQGLAVWCRCTPAGKVSFSGNNYYNHTTPSSFAWVGGSISGSPADYSGWVTKSGEIGSVNAAINYPDPLRSLEKYAQSLGQAATLNAFIAGVRAQTKGNWQTAYTATAIDDYIRGGFGIAALGSSVPPSAPPVYALSYASGANGSLSGAVSQSVSSGSSGAAVTAVPNAGYHFVNWSDSSTANPRTETNVTNNVNVTANFSANVQMFTLTYLAGANGSLGGTTLQNVSSGSNGSAVTAVPNVGYQFSSWSDGATSNPRLDANVTGNINVTASFSLIPVTPVASGGGGGGGSSPVPPTVTPTQNNNDSTVNGTYVPAQALAATPDINTDKGLNNQTPVANCTAGTLIKASYPTVYYCGRDGRRYVFPNDKVYYSWYDDFSSVQIVSDETMASIALGGNVTYRPGKRMIKIQSDPKVYAVARGGVLRWISTEAKARALFGDNWNKMIDDVSDSFFVNYQAGTSI